MKKRLNLINLIIGPNLTKITSEVVLLVVEVGDFSFFENLIMDFNFDKLSNFKVNHFSTANQIL